MNTALTHTAPQAALSVDTRKLIDASISQNTIRTYSHALKQFAEYLGERSPHDALVADYITFRFSEGLAPASIAAIVAALRFAEKTNDAPAIIGPITRQTLKGIKRQGRDRGKGQAQGLQWTDVEIMARQAEREDSPQGKRDAAIIRLMSDGLLRISEVCAVQYEDIESKKDESGILTIRHSKTDQDGKGATMFLGKPTMAAIARYREHTGICEGALFRRMWSNGRLGDSAITVNAVRDIIKARAHAAGVDGYISGHSLRVGSAQSLAEKGATLVQLQNAGRWSDSQMPAHYTRKEQAAKGAIARLKYGR